MGGPIQERKQRDYTEKQIQNGELCDHNNNFRIKLYIRKKIIIQLSKYCRLHLYIYILKLQT